MKFLDWFFKSPTRHDLLEAELASIKSAMPIAVAERDRLKKNKKRHACLDDLIKEHKTRQLEIEMALKG